MGFSGLVRWPNAPTTGLDLVKQNIVRNNMGIERAKWHVAIKSFRTVSGLMHGFPTDRSMCAITMGNVTFVSLEDPAAPQVADMAALAQASANPPESATSSNPTHGKLQTFEPSHYRTTFVTVSPPGALETLIVQLGARWVSTRQPNANSRNQAVNAGNQLTIEGSIFSIGTDWLVRVGNVQLTGGAVKGMLLEAEYLPLPKLQCTNPDGTSELLSELLVSIIPYGLDAKPYNTSIYGPMWDEMEWNCPDPKEDSDTQYSNTKQPGHENDDIYVYGDEEELSEKQKGDWTGVDRDRRSAFMIMGSLKSDGIL